MTRTSPPAEAVTRVAPLGIRFRDAATGTSVCDGLRVACRATPGATPRTAGLSPSGTYVLRGLPLLGATERGDGSEQFWSDPPVSRSYPIEVTDGVGRYLPVRFDAAAPARGLFTPAYRLPGTTGGRPPGPGVPLFSSPGRPVPSGTAVLRAQLARVPAPSEPASWAVLEVVVPHGPSAFGVADANGAVAVLFPYPELLVPDPAVPTAVTPPLSRQTWMLGLRAYLGPAPVVAGPRDVPDLAALLGQPPARPLADAAGTPLVSVRLRYGRELVVRTSGNSNLLISTDPVPVPPAVQGSPHA
ncbi:hypothetical protein ACFXG6_25365 [Streptomyces roseus]|uniref:hypothetical protein n=1 Tax=Streptomyces roseus TaxID=66430 RepID=UPI00367DEE9B